MAGLLVGVNLGGTSIKTELADESGRVLVREVIPTESLQGRDRIFAHTADLIHRLLKNTDYESPQPQRQLQQLELGTGVPWLFHVQTETTTFLPNLPTPWRDIPAAVTHSKQPGSPVLL